MTETCPVRPWRVAFMLQRRLPSSVTGSVKSGEGGIHESSGNPVRHGGKEDRGCRNIFAAVVNGKGCFGPVARERGEPGINGLAARPVQLRGELNGCLRGG